MKRQSSTSILQKLLFMATCLLLTATLKAQIAEQMPTKSRIREVGLYAWNLDGFGVTYRFGNEKAVWRIQAFNANFNVRFLPETHLEKKDYSLDAGLSLGREYRTAIRKNLEFRYGADLGCRYYESERVNLFGSYTITELSPGIGVLVGLNYKIKDRIIFGAELVPTLSYNVLSIRDQNYYPSPPFDYTEAKLALASENVARLSFCVRF